MKKLFTFLLVSGLGYSAMAQTTPAPDPNAPVFQFKEETFDFGNIPQNVAAPHVFVFTNVGKSPLVISAVDKSCGCTQPSFDPAPVLPGRSGSVTATYNAAAPGAFTKSITVHSNASEPTKVLFIKGMVIATASDNTSPGNQGAQLKDGK